MLFSSAANALAQGRLVAVILRCELLRASKDRRTHCAEHHPSRRGQAAAPQDDASCFSGDDGVARFSERPEIFYGRKPQNRLRINSDLPSEFNLIWGVQSFIPLRYF
jgi:hypothetical protein